MAAIAAFAKSDQGQDYAAICRYWGVDPAASFRSDVVATNLRAALMAASENASDEQTPPGDEWEAAAALNERQWLTGV